MPKEERTEQATEQRKRKARERGQVAKSVDLTSSIVFLAFALLLPTFGSGIYHGMMETMRLGISSSGSTEFSPSEISQKIMVTGMPLIYAWMPLIGATMLVGISANLLQVGLLWTWHPMKPDFNRLNPMNGMQRLLSSRAFVEMSKASIKTAIIGWTAWSVLQHEWALSVQTGLMSPMMTAAVVGTISSKIALRVGFLWFTMAAFDYGYQKWMHTKSIRMTKEEVKREHKENDGDPLIKGKIRQRQKQMARRRMMQDVKTADVVVTNPVTYAIALKYDSTTMAAPKVLAKGRHLIAQKIREEAEKNGVPIVPNPPLARELYATVEIGENVPNNLFQAVAEVLAYVYNLRQSKLFKRKPI